MPKPDSDLIERYFANRCRPEEAETVLTWLATDEGQAFYDKYLNDRIEKQEVTDHQTAVDTLKLLRGVYDRIYQREGSLSARNYRWYWAAAAITLLIVGAWIIVYSIRPGQQIVETAYGETQQIQLDDGTRVMLNANSSLRYQTGRPRIVWLEGEAFFDVSHAKDHSPFKVHTTDLTVNVLGTEFNVNTRHQKTDVVLRDGKVRLALESTSTSDLTMKPGDRVSYAHQVDELERQVVNTDTYTSWTGGTIVFDHTPLAEIFMLIEDTYGVEIEVYDPTIKNKEFTGEVAQRQEVLLTLLQKSFGFKISQEGNTIYLNKEN